LLIVYINMINIELRLKPRCTTLEPTSYTKHFKVSDGAYTVQIVVLFGEDIDL
jgi:hypothetical protein